ncbi:DUF2213 domain-containing protein [Candidatus Woesearchaeota archaeon]|nr:DUF2213 domain-containing protein [Candidatus Woesearchaeota archaeon]
MIDSNLQICDKSLKRTPQGYLMFDAIIARSGSQEYLAFELGIFGEDPNRRIMIDRPPEEVTDPMSVASFINMPATDEHPPGGQVTPDNFSKYAKGIVIDASATESNHVKASLVVHDAGLIKKIEDGKRELSAGYQAEIEFSDDGKSAVQRRIRGNHVALVDAARCGKECSIFDSKPIPKEVINMAKMKINGVEYEIADSVAPAVLILIKDNETLETKLEDSVKEVSRVQAVADAAEEEAKAAKKKMEDEEEDDKEKEKKIEDAANERVSVLLSAAKIIKDYDPSGKSLSEIKRDVVTDALPDLDLSEKDDAYVEARFDILSEESSGQTRLNDGLRQQMQDGDITDAVSVARKKKIERSQNAYKGEKK